MPSFEARADVLDATAHTATKDAQKGPKRTSQEQDAPPCSIPSTLQRLFAASPAAIEEDSRSAKRRKLDASNHVDAELNALNEDESIVLSKVVLELNLLPSANCTSPDRTDDFAQDSHEPLQVSLESFDRSATDSFHLRMYNLDTGAGATLFASLDSKVLDQITPELHAAASLCISRDGKKSRSIFRASFCRCQLIPPLTSSNTYKLQIEVRWKLGLSVVEHPVVQMNAMKQDLRILTRYFADNASHADKTWTLSDFYDSVHVPPIDLEVSSYIAQILTNTSLYPFQQRSVDWALRREGVQISSSGTTTAYVDTTPPASFKQSEDTSGRTCYVSQLRGMVVDNLENAQGDRLQTLKGGILAEEMGLGKTVELIALMSLNKRKSQGDTVFDAYIDAHVRPTGATLIITPPSILEQWINELNVHAPEMKVLHYKGLPARSAPQREHDVATADNLLEYDVVVTTYNVLSKEIHHARPPPDRSFRNAKKHERRNSPLMEISWWRVCLDEAQMIENGVSQAATVARIIPRCNAWAISGTPLRKDVQDLRGLLVFLRCDVFANNKAVWDRLDKASFRSIFGHIALRHTKDKVRDELRLPPQKRIVLTVPFTTIEEQNYSDLIRQMCDACWLTPEGLPIDESRDASHPEVVERMREWLVRLRQTCLHAHVGRKNRRALGARNGALRTVHEVLEIMIEQNDTNWKSEAREMILHNLKLGHIKAYAGNIDKRAQNALVHYQGALELAQAYVKICRDDLALEHQRLAKLPDGEAKKRVERSGSESEEEKETEQLGRIPTLRKTLRSFLEVEHACKFFIATSWHQIKENENFTLPESEDYHRLDSLESDWYQQAKEVRRELLKSSKRRAISSMNRVESRLPFAPIPKVTDLPDLGGIESRPILDTMDNISDFLNAQAEQIQIWRSKIVEILLLRLIDDEDDKETTGEEYDESLKAQDELYVYIMALRTLIADRNTAINGLQDILIEHELKAAEKQALRKDIDEEKESRGHAPELVIEVAETRRKLQAGLRGGSLKGVVSGVRSLLTALQWRADGGDARSAAELSIAQKQFTKIQEIAKQQAKITTDLEQDQELFRATMNQRLEYYRQFQHISDTVAKYKEDLDATFDEREFEKCNALRDRKAQVVAGLKTKHTYLTHLRSENQEDVQADCIICQDVIEVGVLTTCGHKYCKECINQWWHQHRTCPMCKQKLGSSDFKDISFKPSEIKAQEENHEPPSPSQAPTPTTNSTSIYSDISDSTLKEIKMIDLNGSYGTKIDMIARHILWIRANDPGAKSLIFSQFSDFLEVLREALRKWKIGVSGIVDKNGIQQFKSDPAIECFLLDAKSDSSGLNLVNATYVFLCEPLINPAIELQAIARVHRIGQQRPTTVFMYLIRDTVEEAIYDISVARRLEHMRSTSSTLASRSGTATPIVQENTLDKANSAELQAAPLKALLRKKGNGEEVKEGDLWHCLFGKQRRAVKPVIEREVGRHLRVEAAENRLREGRF